jgi:hypothetical protein
VQVYILFLAESKLKHAHEMLLFLYNGVKMASNAILTYFRHFYSRLAVDTVTEIGILISFYPDFN